MAEERARVQAEAQVVRSRREELTSIQHQTARSRLRDGVHINPTNLFTTPNGPDPGIGPGSSAAAGGAAGGGAPPPPPPPPPQKHLVAAVPTDHPLKEESEEEQLVAWDLSLTDFTLQRDIILIQWTTFMQRL